MRQLRINEAKNGSFPVMQLIVLTFDLKSARDIKIGMLRQGNCGHSGTVKRVELDIL